MATEVSGLILAIVTTDVNKAAGGGCPIFVAADLEEQVKMSMYLSRITGGVVHDLGNGVYFIFKH
ncbi:MAG TPA: hypothetical protein VFC73_08550 [Syntrophomonadaceae bacterium]|nr:hypothetical protein [Syntrophomonadaceae bacterium]